MDNNNSSRPEGVLQGILGGGVPPDSPNLDPISDQKTVIFHTRFQTRPLKSILDFTTWRLGRNYVIIT